METIGEIIPFAKEMLNQRPNRGMLKIYMLGSTLAMLGLVGGLVETIFLPFVEQETIEDTPVELMMEKKKEKKQVLKSHTTLVCPEVVDVLETVVIENKAKHLRGSGSKAASSPAENYHLARRRTLQVVVSALLTECGFESAEKAAVETLTEMMQSYITEIGRCAKAYCEHTARSIPTLSDTVVTLIEMGFNVDTLPVYAKRSQRMVITAPPVTNPPVTPKALSAGQKRTHPPHIPGHFPEFPDPHTYIKTPTFREPVSDYQVVREKAATQRRDVERALTRFMAKTGETQSLFKDDITAFPLIAARPSAIPYLSALLPSELELQTLEETDSSEQDDQTDSENTAGNIITDDPGADKENSMLPPSGVVPSTKASEDNVIDNPYLRPVKKPKVRRKK